MAGSTVTLSFIGDSKSLEGAAARSGSALDRVSGAADKLGGSSRLAGDRLRESAGGLEKLRDRADETDTKAMGFRDTITGVSDTIRGFSDPSLSMEERLLTLGMGVGDLGSGLYNFLIPALGGLFTLLKTSVIPTIWGFTAALLANPMTWIVLGIIALIAAIVLLIIYWDDVKAAVGVAVDWIKDKWNTFVEWIKPVFTDVKDWIIGAWNSVVSWFQSLPGKVRTVFENINLAIRNAFKSAFNWVANLWNRTVGSFSFSVPDWVPSIGGRRFSLPKIPVFHNGGVVPGAPGSEQLALLQAGERVIPRNQADTQVTISFSGSTDSVFASAFMKLVRTGAIRIA